MDNTAKITQKLLQDFIGMALPKQISLLKETPRSISVLQKIEQGVCQKILGGFKPKDLMLYLAKQMSDSSRNTQSGITTFVMTEIQVLFRKKRTAYMNVIVNYIVNFRSSDRLILQLPEKYMVEVIQKALAKIPRIAMKAIEKKFDRGDFNTADDEMDAIQSYCTETGSWLVDMFAGFDQDLKLTILKKITHEEMQHFFETVWVQTRTISGIRPEKYEIPICILLLTPNFDRDDLESENMNDFLSEIVNWPNDRLFAFLFYIESYHGYGYSDDIWSVRFMLKNVVQNLPLTRVIQLLKKNKYFDNYLSSEQKFDLKATKSNTVMDIKYSIVNLKRSPDLSGLTSKESFQLLATMVN